MAYDTINSLYKVTAEKYLCGEQSEYFLPYLSASPFVTPPPSITTTRSVAADFISCGSHFSHTSHTLC